MVVQYFEAFPIELTLIDTPRCQFGKKPRLFIHLDHHGVSWSSVYTSSKSHVVLKLAAVPKRDKVELERQLSIEKATYHKLSRDIDAQGVRQARAGKTARICVHIGLGLEICIELA